MSVFNMFAKAAVALLMLAALTLTGYTQADPEPTYAPRGTHSVGVVDVTVGNGDDTLNATVWYPALNPDEMEERYTYDLNGLLTVGQALDGAQPDLSAGPYPVIVYSHGLFGARFESTRYIEHLASWGFVVIAADHIGSTFFDTTSATDVLKSFGRRPQEITRLIDHLETLNTEVDFAGLFDMDSVGVTGFSFGGYSALMVGGAVLNSEAIIDICEGFSVEANALCGADNRQLLAQTVGLDAVPDGLWPSVADERVKAVVLLAPCCVDFIGVDGLVDFTLPTLVIGGSADTGAPVERHGQVVFDHINSEPRALAVIEGAGHEVYLDIYAGDIVRAHDLIGHLATAFFSAQLKGDINAAAQLEPSAVNFPEISYTAVGFGEE
ncbi:MAG: dienelactone hydrolase family protein [Anaerolineae bacterium]|jgi:predicted dienelactone hydrolase|nr:dienelactone hydrolase family protein [Anaerolineae bacterium]